MEITRDIPYGYRCYEVTRLLRKELAKRNIKAEVKDGYAFYYIISFFEEAHIGNCFLEFSDSTKRGLILNTARSAFGIGEKKHLRENFLWRIPIKHSWNILPEEKYLIDCHNNIDLSEHHDLPLLQKFPILSEIEAKKFIRIASYKKTLTPPAYLVQKVIYWERAIQKENIIYYPEDNYSVSLRCSS